MKELKKLSAVLMAVVLCFSIVSCDKNDDEQQLVGRWSYVATSTAMVLELREDMTFSSSSITVATPNEVYRGTWSTDGDQITFSVESQSVVYKYFATENNITLIENGVEYPLYRIVTNPNVVGNWNVISTHVIISALKDTLVLPQPVFIDGVEIPISIPVSELQGEFVKKAVNEYLQNLTITDTQLQYEVTANGERIQMTKDYSMEDFYMNVSGQVLGLDYNTNVTFPVFESRENKRLTMFLHKEVAAEMPVGFVNIHTAMGEGQGGTPEDIAAFKQVFNETFEEFSIVLVLTPRN